ncbi:hypothetical protein, partial [Sphingomonas sp. DC3200b1]
GASSGARRHLSSTTLIPRDPFSTVSTGCDTKYRYCGEFDRQGQVSLIARSAPAIMCLSWK